MGFFKPYFLGVIIEVTTYVLTLPKIMDKFDEWRIRMTKEEVENIKYRLSNISTQVGELALNYIVELEAENEQIKNSDTLCKVIGEQKLQIEKMKCLLNELYSEFGFSELVKVRNDLPTEIQEVL